MITNPILRFKSLLAWALRVGGPASHEAGHPIATAADLARFVRRGRMAKTATGAQPLANDRYSVAPAADGVVQLTAKDAGAWTFRGDFVVLIATADPKPAMRPGNIPRVSYNLITWQTPAPPARLRSRP
jgi:hypothetical protein